MNSHPIVSIIIPCFNYGRFILDAISSVEKCRSDSYELIIVNDGSTDLQTQEVLESLAAQGYRVINQENKGVSAARNTGIAAAHGKYILPLDADDEIYPAYLQSAVDLLESDEKVGVVYGRAEFFGAQHGEWSLPALRFDAKKLLLFNYIYISAIYRRDIWAECGGYDPQMDELEDWDFWLSVAERGWRFAQLDELVFRYRIHESSKMYVHRIEKKVPSDIQAYVMCKHSEFYREHLSAMYQSANRLEHWIEHPFRGIARLFLLRFKALFGNSSENRN